MSFVKQMWWKGRNEYQQKAKLWVLSGMYYLHIRSFTDYFIIHWSFYFLVMFPSYVMFHATKYGYLIGGIPRNRSTKCEQGGCSRSKPGGNCIAFTFVYLHQNAGQTWPRNRVLRNVGISEVIILLSESEMLLFQKLVIPFVINWMTESITQSLSLLTGYSSYQRCAFSNYDPYILQYEQVKTVHRNGTLGATDALHRLFISNYFDGPVKFQLFRLISCLDNDSERQQTSEHDIWPPNTRWYQHVYHPAQNLNQNGLSTVTYRPPRMLGQVSQFNGCDKSVEFLKRQINYQLLNATSLRGVNCFVNQSPWFFFNNVLNCVTSSHIFSSHREENNRLINYSY